jgi:hypothetical protein
LGIFLTVEFLGSQEVTVGDFQPFKSQGHACRKVGYNRTFVNAVTVFPSISVQKDSMGHALDLGCGKQVQAEPAP